MKKILLLMLGMLSLPAASQAQQTTFTYDLVKAYKPSVALNNFNCGWAFYSYEKEGKTDSKRQDYKGYAVDSVSKSIGLPEECHVWVRNPRLVQTINDAGFYNDGNDGRNMAVDGLTSGDKVIFKYTSESDDETKTKMIYATGASGLTCALINGDTLRAGLSVINSGDTIVIDSAKFVNSKKVEDGYISVLLYKKMAVASVKILKGDGSELLYDFTKAGTPVAISNFNRNQSKEGKIYVNQGEGKENRNRNDFKGYTPDSVTASLGLPDECHIFQGQNRIVQYLTHRGVYVSGNTQWAVDGLDSADVVEIEYIAPGLSDDKQHILFTNGTSATTKVFLNNSTDTLAVLTPINSGDSLTVATTSDLDGQGNVNGYVTFQAYKGMYIQKIVITKHSVADGIKAPTVSVAPANTDNAWYTLSGVMVEKPQNGVYIHNGKKIIVK